MRALWNGTWIETPAYTRAPQGRLLEIERTVPLALIPNASGRVIARPAVKTLRFLVTDGPKTTYRKAKSKLAEQRFSGDYHLIAALGRCVDNGGRYVCVGARLPPCAEFLLVHRDLCREVPDDFSVERFEQFAQTLAGSAEELVPAARQSYLYSDMAPPRELRAALDQALNRNATTAAIPSPESHSIAPPRGTKARTSMRLKSAQPQPKGLPVAVLGAGDYVRMEVATAVRRAGTDPFVVCDREPQIAALAARKMGFPVASTNAHEAIDLLEQPGVVIIATNHDSHAELASLALERGHRVFLEKPAVITAEDLQQLLAACERAPGRLEIGFNRRYNPLVCGARSQIEREKTPVTVVCTIREVSIEPDHWYFWPNQGTRVAGNLCHWIDLAVFLMSARADPVSVTVSPPLIDEPRGFDSERSFSIEFADGSLACLVATGRGDEVRGVHESIEARSGQVSVHVDDLRRMTTVRNGRVSRRRTLWRDRGHQRMYHDALSRARHDLPASYPIRDLTIVSAIQLAATELAPSGEARCELEGLMDRFLPAPA